jgi:hypothetical protein
MFKKRKKQFLNKVYVIEFSGYNLSNMEEPFIREREILDSFGTDGYELVSVVSIPRKDREDDLNIPYPYDKHYYFKKEIIEE